MGFLNLTKHADGGVVFQLCPARHLGGVAHIEVCRLLTVQRLHVAGQRHHRAARRRREGRRLTASEPRASALVPAKGKKAAPPSDGDDAPASTPSDDDDEATPDASGPAADGAVADGPTADGPLPAVDGPAGANAPASMRSSDNAEGCARGIRRR
jgi:hypothetical protein